MLFHISHTAYACGVGLPSIDSTKLKKINFAARIVTGIKKHEHITPALKSLNWSRIESLVVRRDVTKVYKMLMLGGALPKLSELFTPRQARS